MDEALPAIDANDSSIKQHLVPILKSVFNNLKGISAKYSGKVGGSSSEGRLFKRVLFMLNSIVNDLNTGSS